MISLTHYYTIIIIIIIIALYDVHTGFTAQRNGRNGAVQFMMEYLNFADAASAQAVRDEYFERYHATAKGLQVAEREGRFPPPAPAADPNKAHQHQNSRQQQQQAAGGPRFRPEDLAEYWATRLDFSLLGGPKDAQFVRDLQELKTRQQPPLHLVAFSNGPRKYVQRVLQELGLFGENNGVFDADTLFAVDDVLPHCKPERAAFETIFRQIGIMDGNAMEQCVMVEDSMKNVRIAKALGMKTVLVLGKGNTNNQQSRRDAGVFDAPQVDDPAVDVAIERIEDLRAALPGLWDSTPACFAVATTRTTTHETDG